MQTKARPPKNSPAPARKPTPRTASTTNASQDRTWLRRFWIILVFGAFLSGGLIFFQNYSSDKKQKKIEDAYLAVAVQTFSGNSFNVLCRLNLLINADQEEELKPYQKALEVLITATLSNLYQSPERPSLEDVQLQLRRKINDRLPEDLQVRDVLIEQLLVGNS